MVLDRAVAADRWHGLLLDGPQELRLQPERPLADLVEEERPAVGRLEQAAARLAGAREGALPEAEQLRLEQLFRDRRAVHRDERLVAPSAREVERAREQLLANARLAVDQHGRVEPGNRVEQLEDVLHHLALREDVLEREPLLVAPQGRAACGLEL